MADNGGGLKGKRPGVDPKWLRSWKTEVRNRIEWRDMHRPVVVHQLDHFARHGVAPVQSAGEIQDDEFDPPYKNWEKYNVDTDLFLLGLLHLFEVEQRGMAGDAFDSSSAMHGFAAVYTSQVIDLEYHNKAPARYGQSKSFLTMDAVPFTALGFVVGCRTQAVKLARAQIAAYRKGWYESTESPVFTFLLRILAAYLKEPAIHPHGEAQSDPTFRTLFDLWRSPDIEELARACLAACDSHTHRCKEGEFENGDWTRTPIEILLLMKLRQLGGLQNPALDHPLMSTSLGQLPSEVRFEPEDLVKRVRARMVRDGCDEEAILATAASTDRS